jgi:hypothetical protein
MNFEFKDGTTIAFKDFQPKEINMIKIRMVYEDGGEGIWACLNDEDMIDYKNDIKDDIIRPALLRNASIFGMPWGSYVPVIFKGEDRPEADMRNITGDIYVNQKDSV